jgi:hypothetical protein
MNVTCKDRDRILEDGTAAEWAALEGHAATCAACAEELRAWKSLSAAASELRDYSDNPALWQRIRHSLAEEAERGKLRWDLRRLFSSLSISWQTAAASALVLLLLVSAGWVMRPKKDPTQSPLLKSKALTDVERAESAYVQAIDQSSFSSIAPSMICGRRPAKIHRTHTFVTNCSRCIRKNSALWKRFSRKSDERARS